MRARCLLELMLQQPVDSTPLRQWLHPALWLSNLQSDAAALLMDLVLTVLLMDLVLTLLARLMQQAGYFGWESKWSKQQVSLKQQVQQIVLEGVMHQVISVVQTHPAQLPTAPHLMPRAALSHSVAVVLAQCHFMAGVYAKRHLVLPHPTCLFVLMNVLLALQAVEATRFFPKAATCCCVADSPPLTALIINLLQVLLCLQLSPVEKQCESRTRTGLSRRAVAPRKFAQVGKQLAVHDIYIVEPSSTIAMACSLREGLHHDQSIDCHGQLARG